MLVNVCAVAWEIHNVQVALCHRFQIQIVRAGTKWLPPWRESGDGRATGGLER